MHHDIRFKIRSVLGVVALTLLAFICCSCTPGARVARLLEQANRSFDAGDLEKAEIDYKNVLQKEPQNSEAIARLGMLYQEQGRDARAAAFLLKARQMQPDNLAVRVKLALAYLAASAAKEAREEAVYILQRRPTDPQAPLILAQASTNEKEIDDARQRLQSLPEPAAKGAPVRVALGNLALRQNRVAEAEAGFKEAIATDPKFAAAHSALGVLLFTQKNLAGADAEFKQASDLSPARSPQRLHYAQFKFQTGDIAAAKQALEEMSRKTPDYVAVWLWLTEIAMTEQKIAEADALLAKALTREQIHPDALMLSARLRLAKGETSKAVAEFERLLTMYPRSAPISYHLGVAYAAAGDTNKALVQFTQAAAAAPEMGQAVVAMAEIHLRKRDFTAAIAALKPLVQQHPEMQTAQVLFAEALRGQGNLDEAAAIYTQLKQRFPQDAQPAFALGTVLLQQKKLPEARKEFTQARQLQPDHFAALEQLVELDLRDKQPAVARQRVEADLAKKPQSAQLSLLLARICILQNDTSAAEAALKKTIELQPDSAMALFQLARLYTTSNQQDKAVASLRETTRQNPQGLSAHLLLGLLLDQLKDYAGARAAYEKALVIEPKNSLALNNLSYIYTERFDLFDKGLELAQRARTLLPQEPRTADTLGWALAKKKQYAQALVVLQESAGKLPTEPDVQYHLGVVQYMLGDEVAAQAALQRAVELKVASPNAEDAGRRLALLRISSTNVGADMLAQLEKRVSEQPDDPVALLRLANLLRRQGNNDKALSHYKTIVQTNPKHAVALINMAQIHAAKQNLQKAIESAKAARVASPENPTITHLVGRLAYDTGEHLWAASLLQELARQRPDDVEVLFDWAEAAYSVGRLQEAETSMRRVLELNRNSTRAAAAQQFVDLVSLGANPAQAVASRAKVEQALKENPSSAPALMALALIQQQQSDPNAARQTYEKLLATYPDFPPAQKNLTILYAASSLDPQKAASLATKARAAFPNDIELARAVGILAYRQGDFARTVKLLQEPAAMNKTDSEVLYYIGMSQCRLNKPHDGKKFLEQALNLGLRNDLAPEARRTLAAAK